MIARRPLHRRLAALLVALALLVQGMAVVACDLHDAMHVLEAATHGHAVDDHSQHPEQDEDGWHALFHAGHHCHHVPVPAVAAQVRLSPPAASTHALPPAAGPPDAPVGLLLRPPIQA